MANIFPRWTNQLPLKIAICAASAVVGVALAFNFYATPKTLVAGYQPAQPIPFSHKIHADQIGLDCRYCHSFAEVSGHSNVPTGNTCWNCHQHVQRESPKLAPLHKSMDPSYPGYDGKPIEWVRIHKVPDYVYFNHSAHVNRGVSCISCHGQVNKMDEVYEVQPLSMSFCLACHRNPAANLRPLDKITDLNWKWSDNPTVNAEQQRLNGQKMVRDWKVQSLQNCSACHR